MERKTERGTITLDSEEYKRFLPESRKIEAEGAMDIRPDPPFVGIKITDPKKIVDSIKQQPIKKNGRRVGVLDWIVFGLFLALCIVAAGLLESI